MNLNIFLISCSVLLLEVALIRWVAAEIRVFAYVKNLVLMACVLGLGLGCATHKDQDGKPGLAFPILLLLVTLVTATAIYTGLTNLSLLIDKDVFDFSSGVTSMTKLAITMTSVACIFIVITALFDSIGRELGKAMAVAPPLKGYAVNLLGSLCGVIAFSVLSVLELGPAVWLAAVLIPLAPLYFANKRRLLGFVVCSFAIIGTALLAEHDVIWSPYYRISTVPRHSWHKDNYLVQTPYPVGTSVDVNHNQHQVIINLSPEFIAQHPELRDSNEYRTYNLPYQASPAPNNVLILGAGTGNDVAAALRNNAKHVDAVEIDPVIARLGKQLHPEHPYDDPRVSLHIGDARGFMLSNDRKYDLIVFGHLDSQTALSTASSVRLDNYLYTLESLKHATSHLSTNGVACLGFSTQPDWLRARIYQMARKAGDGNALAFNTHFFAPNAILVMWGPGLKAVENQLKAQNPDLLASVPPLLEPVELPVDDWPFLYQRARNVPAVTLGMLIFVWGTSAIMIASRFKRRNVPIRPNVQFFLLGAGFLLMETRAMLAISVLFESTWVVNSAIIGLVLVMATLSNIVVIKSKSRSLLLPYAALLIALLVMFSIPLAPLASQPLAIKTLLAGLLLGAPFFCSGLVFSRSFASVEHPDVALGVNILGAIFGGCLEYLSVVMGVNGLTLLAVAVYAASWGFAPKRD